MLAGVSGRAYLLINKYSLASGCWYNFNIQGEWWRTVSTTLLLLLERPTIRKKMFVQHYHRFGIVTRWSKAGLLGL